MPDAISWGLAEIVRQATSLRMDMGDWHPLLCQEWESARARNLLPPHMALNSENAARIGLALGLATGLVRGQPDLAEHPDSDWYERSRAAGRGYKYQGPKHTYKVIQVGPTRHMVSPFRERRGKEHTYVVIESNTITRPDFVVEIVYWCHAPHLEHDHTMRRRGDFYSLLAALQMAVQQIEAKV